MKVLILRFLKKSWYWLVLIASSVILGVVGFSVFNRGKKGNVIQGDDGIEFPERLRDLRERRLRAEFEIERVHLEGEVERARVSAVSEARAAELDRIESVGEADPATARRELAAWLEGNL